MNKCISKRINTINFSPLENICSAIWLWHCHCSFTLENGLLKKKKSKYYFFYFHSVPRINHLLFQIFSSLICSIFKWKIHINAKSMCTWIDFLKNQKRKFSNILLPYLMVYFNMLQSSRTNSKLTDRTIQSP